jgi:hypothetical protein
VARIPRLNRDVLLHFRTITSGNLAIRDRVTRDQLSTELGWILYFEIEAAGLINNLPCLVI